MAGIGASQCSSHEYSVIVNRYQPNWGFFLPNKWSQWMQINPPLRHGVLSQDSGSEVSCWGSQWVRGETKKEGVLDVFGCDTVRLFAFPPTNNNNSIHNAWVVKGYHDSPSLTKQSFFFESPTTVVNLVFAVLVWAPCSILQTSSSYSLVLLNKCLFFSPLGPKRKPQFGFRLLSPNEVS